MIKCREQLAPNGPLGASPTRSQTGGHAGLFPTKPYVQSVCSFDKKGDNIEVMVEASPSIQLCPIFVIVVQNEGYIV